MLKRRYRIGVKTASGWLRPRHFAVWGEREGNPHLARATARTLQPAFKASEGKIASACPNQRNKIELAPIDALPNALHPIAGAVRAPNLNPPSRIPCFAQRLY